MIGFALIALLFVSMALLAGAVSNRWWCGFLPVPLAFLGIVVIAIYANDGGFFGLAFLAGLVLISAVPALLGAAVGVAVLRFGRGPDQQKLTMRTRIVAGSAGVLLTLLTAVAGLLTLLPPS